MIDASILHCEQQTIGRESISFHMDGVSESAMREASLISSGLAKYHEMDLHSAFVD